MCVQPDKWGYAVTDVASGDLACWGESHAAPGECPWVACVYPWSGLRSDGLAHGLVIKPLQGGPSTVARCHLRALDHALSGIPDGDLLIRETFVRQPCGGAQTLEIGDGTVEEAQRLLDGQGWEALMPGQSTRWAACAVVLAIPQGQRDAQLSLSLDHHHANG